MSASAQARLTQPVAIVHFEKSWHSVFHTETDKFTTEMLRFMSL